MVEARREMLVSYGGHVKQECLAYRPKVNADLRDTLQESKNILARGHGHSYGDAALQPAGVVLTGRLNRIIAFDAETGILRAQAGVTIGEAVNATVAHGWLLPVIPGVRQVTLGGAFAANIHGLNNWRQGEFAEHVISIRILLADGESVQCSPQEKSELFWASAGGMGMTGIIEELTLRLRPIVSASLKATSRRIDSVAEITAAFAEQREHADYMLARIYLADRWQGLFTLANHMHGDGMPLGSFTPLKPRLSVPFSLPSALMNRYSMGMYNRRSMKEQSAIVGINDFFHASDAIGHWERLYGRRGILQFHGLIPDGSDAGKKLEELLKTIYRSPAAIFMAHVKYHRQGKSMLSFSQAGYGVAVEFSNTPQARALLPQLQRMLAEYGGRIYLAKDAMLTPELFYGMYGQTARDWCKAIRAIDPGGRFESLMSMRLQWKHP